MKTILTIALKEFRHIIRDPRSLYVALLMPVVMIILYGYAIDMDMKDLTLSVLDYNKSSKSRELIQSLSSNGFIKIRSYIDNYKQLEGELLSNRAKAVLVIPVDYDISLARNNITKVQLIVDGADATSATLVRSYIQMAIAQLNYNLMFDLFNREFIPIQSNVRVYFNPELKSAHFIVTGLTAVIIMMIGALLTSIALTREKELGTLEQLMTTPVNSAHIIFGKLIPYFVIASIDAFLVIGIGIVLFQVPFVGSVWVLIGYSIIFLLIALSFGLMVSTVAKTQQVAMMLALMGTLLPTLLLSGFIFPIASMPTILQYFSNVIPATHFLKIIRGIMLKGENIFQHELIVLCSILMLLVFASIMRFKTRLD